MSKQEEHLPVGAGLMATEGFDRELLEFVKAFVGSSGDFTEGCAGRKEIVGTGCRGGE